MVPEESSPEVREAVDELQLYLSDVLPPLVVADTFNLLLRLPPRLVASNIQSWTALRYRPGSGIKISDYLSYAIKKIFLVGQFRLVPREPFAAFIEELKTLVIGFCPESEREALRRNLDRLDEITETVVVSVDDLIRGRDAYRPEAVTVGAPPTPEELGALRRFSLLVERLGREPAAGEPSSAGAPDPLAAALALAARGARTSEDFDRNLDRLRELGLRLEMATVFHALAASVPGWGPSLASPEIEKPGEPAPAAPPAPPSPPLEAMERIVSQPEDPGEVALRFSEMVKAACERFNEGALAQSVTMLDLAERIIEERGVSARAVEAVRAHGNEALDGERMRRYAEVQKQHALLRRVLNFFTATSPKGLFGELLREGKRERRKLILQLLEVHGLPARQEALARLQSALGQAEGDEKWYFRRNLLYLLRRIPPPRGDGPPPEEDVDAAVRHAAMRMPAPLLKEAIANLGQLKHGRAEKTLITLLGELERMLERPGDSPYDPREVRLLLDRLVAALARFGTAAAHRAVVDHGLKKKTELGDTMARLAELAGQDLSAENDLVERLLAALKASAPYKLFGVVLHQNDVHAKRLIEALSGTRTPEVRAALSAIVERFGKLDLGRAAAAALAAQELAPAVPEAPFDTSSGEMDMFGLPSLVQSLGDAGLSGTLTLKDSRGAVEAEIMFREGMMSQCRARGLTGEEAFYQLLERPAPAIYLFERQAPGSRDPRPAGKLHDFLSLSLEGMRRYDEFQQTAAIIPDDARLRATGVKPEHHRDELDGMLVNGLWKLVLGGATPAACESSLKADSYRVRRQLAYWVETGALTLTGEPNEPSKV